MGNVFKNVRTKVLSGDSKGTAWTEFSVKEIGDVSDKKRWAETNPALGRRIKVTTIESEFEQMDEDTFARERLGWWSPEEIVHVDYALDKESWAKCKSSKSKPEGKTAYGVKFSPDGSLVCLCGAVIDEAGIARISVIEQKSTSMGVRWLADWLNERYMQASCVVIDGRNGVDVLIEKLREVWKYKNSIIKCNTSTVIAAVSTLINEVSESTLTWYEYQEDLNDSATTSIKRPIGSGWGFGGENSTPIEACSLALWGVRNSRRNPKKKQRIG